MAFRATHYFFLPHPSWDLASSFSISAEPSIHPSAPRLPPAVQDNHLPASASNQPAPPELSAQAPTWMSAGHGWGPPAQEVVHALDSRAPFGPGASMIPAFPPDSSGT